VSVARPNAGHLALARLERAGAVTGVITQNVDNLHHLAGRLRTIALAR
jgi:NAD-dependent SIR2 family protein deacetylase